MSKNRNKFFLLSASLKTWKKMNLISSIPKSSMCTFVLLSQFQIPSRFLLPCFLRVFIHNFMCCFLCPPLHKMQTNAPRRLGLDHDPGNRLHASSEKRPGSWTKTLQSLCFLPPLLFLLPNKRAQFFVHHCCSYLGLPRPGTFPETLHGSMDGQWNMC